jgi:glutamin-(asparagin-)ase
MIAKRGIICFLAIILFCVPAWAAENKKPNIVIIGTGGTIAGLGSSSVNVSAYQSAVVAVDKLIAAVPELQNVANVKGEQIFQIGSESYNNERWLKLGKRVAELLKSKDVDGVVITHGTDTIEETGYFLNLTLKSNKPVVIVGAMRPGSAMSADGPLNIYNAVIVASDKNAAGKGVLVVINDEIHSARDISKTNTVKVETFRSLYGPLGTIIEGKPSYYRLPARPHTMQTEFDISKIDSLPEIGVVYAHGQMSRVPYDAFVNAGVKAIIHVGTGSGSVADYMVPVLKEVRSKGVIVVRASRTGSGPVVRNGEANDDELDYVVTDDQNPAKARILLSLALTKTTDTKELQKIFWKY